MSWSRFTNFQSAPTAQTYPSLPDHITYLRLFLGLLCGLYFSWREYQQVHDPNTRYIMSGLLGIIASLNFIMFIPVIFVNFYLNADLDSYKGRLNFVGFTNGLSLALLVWILVFTWIHDKEEGILNQALIRDGLVSSFESAIHVGIESTVDTTQEF